MLKFPLFLRTSLFCVLFPGQNMTNPCHAYIFNRQTGQISSNHVKTQLFLVMNHRYASPSAGAHGSSSPFRAVDVRGNAPRHLIRFSVEHRMGLDKGGRKIRKNIGKSYRDIVENHL